MLMMTMMELISEAAWVPLKNKNVVPYFRTTFLENIDEAYRMMVLSFPTMRFY